MKNYKDIIVDLSNCDTEPIHIIGRIQEHGFLLILNNTSYLVEQLSSNIEHFTGIPLQSFLGHDFSNFVGEKDLVNYSSWIKKKNFINPCPITLNGKTFVITGHEGESNIILELEPFYVSSPFELINQNNYLKELTEEFQSKAYIENINESLVSHIQSYLDYDRVMVYKFDEDWHGSVIAEKVKEGIKSYFNHHFPASDIPVQARKMLLEKRVRQIPDVNHKGAEIIPYYNPATSQPTNIIKSELRNPSEIHLEYLRNMDVLATLSIAIVVKDKLWGLIACQNHSPKFIGYEKRSVCDLIARYYSNALIGAKEKTNELLKQKYQETEKALIQAMENDPDIVKALFSEEKNILNVSEASGAAILINGGFKTVGLTPTESETQYIIDWVVENNFPEIYTVTNLPEHLSSAFQFKEFASGILVAEISKHNKEYLILFKRELEIETSWAGNPDKTLIKDENTMRIDPRKSFEKYVKVTRGKSTPWNSSEVEAVGSIRKAIVATQLKLKSEKLRDLNQKLEYQNSQLDDFTHLASHNLLSPLNNIQSLLALCDQGKIDIGTTLEKIALVARNMKQTFIDLHEILEVSAVKDISRKPLNLNYLIDKQLENISTQVNNSQIEIIKDLQVEIVDYSSTYLESLLHNLISNAVKYRAVDRRPYIKISSGIKDERVAITVSDNGLGMDLEKNKDRIFGMYKTFHRNNDSRGLGLYLVKKQLEALNGKIEVFSKVGEGTTFKVIL